MELPSDTETLTLYVVWYHFGKKEVAPSTPAHVTFLYARDQADAEYRAGRKVQAIGIHAGSEVHKEAVCAFPGGYTVWRTRISGTIQVEVGDPRYA